MANNNKLAIVNKNFCKARSLIASSVYMDDEAEYKCCLIAHKVALNCMRIASNLQAPKTYVEFSKFDDFILRKINDYEDDGKIETGMGFGFDYAFVFNKLTDYEHMIQYLCSFECELFEDIESDIEGGEN